jgi:hypothetical protein
MAAVVLGIWFGLAGAVALLAGLSGMRQRNADAGDPVDPLEVLVYGRRRRHTSDVVFVVVGIIFVAIGALIGIFAP